MKNLLLAAIAAIALGGVAHAGEIACNIQDTVGNRLTYLFGDNTFNDNGTYGGTWSRPASRRTAAWSSPNAANGRSGSTAATTAEASTSTRATRRDGRCRSSATAPRCPTTDASQAAAGARYRLRRSLRATSATRAFDRPSQGGVFGDVRPAFPTPIRESDESEAPPSGLSGGPRPLERQCRSCGVCPLQRNMRLLDLDCRRLQQGPRRQRARHLRQRRLDRDSHPLERPRLRSRRAIRHEQRNRRRR